MAVSVDGFIAKKDGDSNWVLEDDWPIFEAQIKEKGCIIVGRKTFIQYHNDIYPIKGVINIVLTKDRSITDKNKNVIFATSPKNAVKKINELGHKKALLIGGGTTNGSFFNDNLIDEVILSVHPLVLGEGIKLFEGCVKEYKLRKVSTKKLGKELVQLRYEVLK